MVCCSNIFTSITKNVYISFLTTQIFRLIGSVTPNCLHSPSSFQIEYSSYLRSEPRFAFQVASEHPPEGLYWSDKSLNRSQIVRQIFRFIRSVFPIYLHSQMQQASAKFYQKRHSLLKMLPCPTTKTDTTDCWTTFGKVEYFSVFQSTLSSSPQFAKWALGLLQRSQTQTYHFCVRSTSSDGADFSPHLRWFTCVIGFWFRV